MLLGVSVVKNESDIIESMIRLNLRYLDHFHIFDNGSVDGTLEIIQHLASEFDNVTYSIDNRLGYNQKVILNDFLNHGAKAYSPTKVIPLDADEIICGDPEEVRHEFIRRPKPLRLRWVTYVPTKADDQTIQNPFQRITHRREFEPKQYYKVSVPSRAIGRSQLSQGSHNLENVKIRNYREMQSKTAYLAHFPVRSSDQIAAKAIIGNWNIIVRKRESENEAWYWKQLSQEFLDRGHLCPDSLTSLAASYASSREAPILEDPPDLPDIELKYMDLQRSSLAHKLASFSDEFFQNKFLSPELSNYSQFRAYTHNLETNQRRPLREEHKLTQQ